jgi:hypothetical protein
MVYSSGIEVKSKSYQKEFLLLFSICLLNLTLNDIDHQQKYNVYNGFPIKEI